MEGRTIFCFETIKLFILGIQIIICFLEASSSANHQATPTVENLQFQ